MFWYGNIPPLDDDVRIVISYSRAACQHEAQYLADYFRAQLPNYLIICNTNPKNDLLAPIKHSNLVLVLLTPDYFNTPQCIAECYEALNMARVLPIFLPHKPVDLKKLLKRLTDLTSIEPHEWDLVKTRYHLTEPPKELASNIKQWLESSMEDRPLPLEFAGPHDAETVLRALNSPHYLPLSIPFDSLPVPDFEPLPQPTYPSLVPPDQDVLPLIEALKGFNPSDQAQFRVIELLLRDNPLKCVSLFHAGLAPILLVYMELSTSHARTHDACVSLLYSLASVRVQCQALLDMGVHWATLKSLAQFPSKTSLVLHATQLLTVLAKEANASARPLTQPFFALTKLLLCVQYNSDPEVMQGGFLLLASLASPVTVPDLVLEGAIDWALDAMRAFVQDKMVVDAALTCLRALGCTRPAQLQIVTRGVGKILFDVFFRHGKEAKVMLHTLWTIQVLSSHEDNCVPMFDMGLGAMLISALRLNLGNKEICRWGVGVLRNLAGNPYIAGSLFDLSVAPTLVEILTQHTSKVDKSQMQTLALWEASVDPNERLQRFLRGANWSLVDDYRPATDMDIAREVLGTFDRFANKQALLEPMVAAGVAKQVIYTVRLYMGDWQTAILACQVLAKLGLEKQNRDVLFALGAAQVAVDVLRTYSATNMDVVSVAGDVLLHLAGDLSRRKPVVDSEGIPLFQVEEEQQQSQGDETDEEEESQGGHDKEIAREKEAQQD